MLSEFYFLSSSRLDLISNPLIGCWLCLDKELDHLGSVGWGCLLSKQPLAQNVSLLIRSSLPDEHSVEKITHWISNGSEKGALKR